MRSSDAPLTPRLFAAALLLSSGLQIGESLLPRLPLFPWLRLGFSWAILLPFLLSFGTWSAFQLFALRNVLALVCGGQAASSFLLSGVSGTASLLLLGPPVRFLVRRGILGWAGGGALLAAGFNLVQLATAADVLVASDGLFSQMGPLLAWSGISGAGMGFLAHRLWRSRSWERVSEGMPELPGGLLPDRAALGRAGASFAVLLLSFAISRFDLLLALLMAALLLGGRHLRTLWGAWPFLLWLAWFHLPTPGHLLSPLPVTREGCEAFARYGLRLAVFLLSGQELGRTFPWHRLARHRAVWAQGLALALPCAVRIFPAALGAARDVRSPVPWEERFWTRLRRELGLDENPKIHPPPSEVP